MAEDFLITDEMKLRVLERELALRRSFYPKLVERGKMKLDRMEYEIAVIEFIIDDYKAMIQLQKEQEEGGESADRSDD